MPYTNEDHRRNCRQIDVLLGQRPSRKNLLKKSHPRVSIEFHLNRLEWLRYTLMAPQKEFTIVFLPAFSGTGRKKVKRRHAVQHVRFYRRSLSLALSRLNEDIDFLNKQLTVVT